MSQVIIGMDPHERPATIEIMTSDEATVGGGRHGTDAAGYRAMLAEVKGWPQRTWAIEGCQGHRLAHREPAAGRGRTCGSRAAEAVGPHPGIRDRAGP
jgi:transposase